jgi:hypothetical protein
MATLPTDFYLNLDRWESLSGVERLRGRWETRMEGPAARLDPIRRNALLEGAWSIASPGSALNRRVHTQISSSSQPQGADPAVLRAWRYYRAAQFVHGWHAAFRWTTSDIKQLCRVLAEPEGEETEQAASVLSFLQKQAARVSQQVGGIRLIELAAFYGGLRCFWQDDATHLHLYLLGFRLLLLQSGYVQILFGPLETSCLGLAGKSPPPLAPPWDEREENLEDRLGAWLDELVQLLLDTGQRAERLWSRAQEVSSRSSLQEAILDLAHRNGRITAGDILRETGANRNTVKDNLARLVHQGRLERKGSKRGTIYLPA